MLHRIDAARADPARGEREEKKNRIYGYCTGRVGREGGARAGGKRKRMAHNRIDGTLFSVLLRSQRP